MKENTANKGIHLEINSSNENFFEPSEITTSSPVLTATNSTTKCKSSHSIDAILGLRAAAAAAAQAHAAQQGTQQEATQSQQYFSNKPSGE